MFDIKRRYQNVENILNERAQNLDSSQAAIRREKVTHIKHNVKNLHILGYFVIAVLVCLYTFRLVSNHIHAENSKSSFQQVASDAFDSNPFSIYNFDFSYFTGAIKNQQKRTSVSDLPRQLASTEDLCDFYRFTDDALTDEKFNSEFKNTKPMILFFYQDLKDWGYPHAWQYAKLNSTFKDTIVQFGRSVDADYELRETTFSHFLKNLIGQTDLRGEPWQIRDSQLLSANRHNLLKKVKFLEEWNSDKSSLQLGTTLSSTGFQLNPSGATVVGVVKGRMRVFIYPAATTPPAGYEQEVDMLSWFELIYPKLTATQSAQRGQSPLECILEAGEILYIPEAWFWSSINIGTTTKVVFFGQKPATRIGKTLTEVGKLELTRDNSPEEIAALMKLWNDVEKLLPDSEFVRYEKAKLSVKLGKLEEALDMFRSLSPFFIMAQVEIARITNQLTGDWKKAVEILNQTLEIVPRTDTVLRELAFLYHERELHELAGDYFKNSALLSAQIEQQLEDLKHAEENYNMLSFSIAIKTKRDQIVHLRDHFKEIARNEYTAFKS
ncbi:uncharacterized protein LOC142348428 [Convolutriloba macropyga]|uniref:uncharacterized protein LOC142348428 n=1 Tax=Convolutriloba macropyga TaxID=536237 RepID=UPI003F5239C1